ncbi:MAG TPA: type II toxin-antitoxin system VapC family toxin [Caulobacteraceae bacterium]|nr:type II toxin-antitoxin system VapC family toxin [Caulobacteraceae bacterium]
MALVVDASYAVAVALEEEDLIGGQDTLERIAAGGVIVPAIWRFEVANALLMAVRRKRIAARRPAVILADLEALAITIDEAATPRAWTATFALAESHGLTIYDAAYLELAVRLGAPIASRDGQLIRAARREAVEVLGV